MCGREFSLLTGSAWSWDFFYSKARQRAGPIWYYTIWKAVRIYMCWRKGLWHCRVSNPLPRDCSQLFEKTFDL